MKYSSKSELILDCQTQWQSLWGLLDGVSDDELEKRPPSVKAEIKFENEARNRSARSIKDHLAHLYCWHRMLLQWINSDNPDLPAAGFNWSQTRELNQQLFEEFKDVPVTNVIRRLKLSHGRVMKLLNSLSEKQLLQPGYLAWTKKLGLVSYLAPNSASHYRWAQKKIKKRV